MDLQVCMAVGVTVLTQRLWEESSDVLDLSEAYGQSEALTTRLKHITGNELPCPMKHPCEKSRLVLFVHESGGSVQLRTLFFYCRGIHGWAWNHHGVAAECR